MPEGARVQKKAYPSSGKHTRMGEKNGRDTSWPEDTPAEPQRRQWGSSTRLWSPWSANESADVAVALAEEGSAFQGRALYERGKLLRGYRNGHLPTRELTVGEGAVELRVPPGGERPGGGRAGRLRLAGGRALLAGIGQQPGPGRPAVSGGARH